VFVIAPANNLGRVYDGAKALGDSWCRGMDYFWCRRIGGGNGISLINSLLIFIVIGGVFYLVKKDRERAKKSQVRVRSSQPK